MLFRFILRKLKYLGHANRRPGVAQEKSGGGPGDRAPDLSDELQRNVRDLVASLGAGSDIKVRNLRFGPGGGIVGALVFIDNLIDPSYVANLIARPIVSWRPESFGKSDEKLVDALSEEVLYASVVAVTRSMKQLVDGCLSGNVALFIDGCDMALGIQARGYAKRDVTEPESETVVRGPREGFNEDLQTNVSLIRRKIRSGQLRSELMIVGRRTATRVCLMYLDGVANMDVVGEVRRRVQALDVDAVLESGYIEEYIEDSPLSPFATIGYAEKPDVVAALLLEGRTAIVVDGTPFVLTAPMLLVEGFQSPEDYYSRWPFASLTRALRFVAFGLATLAPAVLIALTSFHQELIPTKLLFTIASAREGTPFPMYLEAFIMVFMFEIVREAGIRLPRPVGQAVSIVGALVMGNAAVSAGLVGPAMVIVVAITAIASFVVPALNSSVSILRIIMMLMSAMLGWYGIAMGLLGVSIHLATLTSFGVPFFDGLDWTSDLKDTVVRMPLWSMVSRPRQIVCEDEVRHPYFVPPEDGQTADDAVGSSGKKP